MIADIVPTDITGLAIILLALVPGYLTVSIWGRRKTWKGRSADLSTVVESITFSAVIQVLALPATLGLIYPYRNHLDAHEFNVAIWLIIVVLGAACSWWHALGVVIELGRLDFAQSAKQHIAKVAPGRHRFRVHCAASSTTHDVGSGIQGENPKQRVLDYHI